jgi:hypothetical protein
MGRTFTNVLRHRLALGLFVLRLVVAVSILSSDSGATLIKTGLAFLLGGGLWTSTVGAVIALIDVWDVVYGSGGRVSGLVAAMSVALALTGPGAWSVDAQLRGWRRIRIPLRERDGNARPG